MADDGVDVLQGTLDMLVLKALAAGPLHGYAILDWLRRTTGGELRLVDAALYPSLHRMEAGGLIASTWGLSENNRKAKFYRLTPAGRRALRAEAAGWARYVALVARVLGADGQIA